MSLTYLRILTSCIIHGFAILLLYINDCFTAWIDPISKKEGHCDTTVRTVDSHALYILYCLTYMYCTYRYTMYIPYFPVHTRTLSTPYIYCTLYVLCTLFVHLTQTSLLFATHVHILAECSLLLNLLNTLSTI